MNNIFGCRPFGALLVTTPFVQGFTPLPRGMSSFQDLGFPHIGHEVLKSPLQQTSIFI